MMAIVELWSGNMTIEVYLKMELANFCQNNIFPFPVCMGKKLGNFLTNREIYLLNEKVMFKRK
jgi:hypothetical protein